MTSVRKFIADEDAATAIEYGLIAAAMAVALITAFSVFGDALLGLFDFVRDRAGNAMNNAGI